MSIAAASDKVDFVASFSQDGSKFAFQASIAQKDNIDIYPLDSRSGYKVNSSLVNSVDYEDNEFKASDLKSVGWCKKTVATSATKRRNSTIEEENEEDNNEELNVENYFINVFPQGQIVVYSSNGKDIVNIIRNKKEIIGMDTIDSKIWFLDNEKGVKIYEYNSNKPTKTFTLIDGKTDEILNFQTFKIINQEDGNESVLITLITENMVYIIDPSKRRPTTRAQFELFGAVSCEISSDGKYIVIADIEKLNIFDIESQDLIQSWLSIQSEKIKLINNLIFTLNIDGNITVFNLDPNQDNKDVICKINVIGSEAIDFKEINNNVLIAWLNVNEPNFKLLSIESVNGNGEIIINEEESNILNNSEKSETISVDKKDDAKEEDEDEDTTVENETSKHNNKKVSKQEQNELVSELSVLLENNESQEKILKNITKCNSIWTDSRIVWFINNKLNNSNDDKPSTLLFKCIIDELSQDDNKVWDSENATQLNLWMKWLLTLRPIPNSYKYDKHNRKQLKHLKSSLKSSIDSLPTLLGMQGRLEMLIRQAKLREELSQMALEDQTESHENVIEEGEAGNNIEGATGEAQEENITYLNGESDVFVDAADVIE